MAEKLHIIPHKLSISREDRNKQLKHKSFVVWFSGFSGSGKSTLANNLEVKLHEKSIHTYLLDGDNIRKGINTDLDFSEESRKENLRRIGEIVKLFIDAGTVVMAAFVSPYREDRDKIKELVGEENFVEVFVNCPIEVCEQRDVKGLYKKARNGEIKNFTGISAPFEEPLNPDVVVKTHEMTTDESLELLWKTVKSKL
ncbi:adenylyl-sulfate kinase [Sediminitomix flava]|uniref:Adenylyl-sulfate kinase n=1 Tax=Sediminitomix flava TaxID=379075 RepID=A0A315Z6B2_SEDFL|nr:adenylyl-sulfate kinase [Sediminitomix flava]PWJ39407.1 adenylylsulfate kinase [Sediminitomix flava]